MKEKNQLTRRDIEDMEEMPVRDHRIIVTGYKKEDPLFHYDLVGRKWDVYIVEYDDGMTYVKSPSLWR